MRSRAEMTASATEVARTAEPRSAMKSTATSGMESAAAVTSAEMDAGAMTTPMAAAGPRRGRSECRCGQKCREQNSDGPRLE
jgi:hypothetical protein